MHTFDPLPQVPFKMKVRIALGVLAIWLVFFEVKEFDLEDVEYLLSDYAWLQSWPLLVPILPIFASCVQLGSWILADSATVHRDPWSRDPWDWEGEVFPAWNPGDTTVVLSALVRCAILFITANLLYCFLGPHISDLALDVLSKAVGVISRFLDTCVPIYEEWLAYLDTLIVASLTVILNFARILVIIVLILAHWANRGTHWIYSFLGDYWLRQLTPVVPSTSDHGADHATETPPFWDGLCLNTSMVCRRVRDDLCSLKYTKQRDLDNQRTDYEQSVDRLDLKYHESLRGQKVRDKELREEFKGQIKVANEKLEKLGGDTSTFEVIENLEDKLAAALGEAEAAKREIKTHEGKMKKLRAQNQAGCTRYIQIITGLERKLSDLAQNPESAPEVMVPKNRLDRAQLERNRMSARWGRQQEISDKLRKENEILKKLACSKYFEA